METKEIKINVPEGYEIDKENSTFECIKFKPIKNELPNTWEEFCETHPRQAGEAWIAVDSYCLKVGGSTGELRSPKTDRNLLPSKELAEAMLALCQLIQLRDCYNDGWVPDWTAEFEPKYCVCVQKGELAQNTYWLAQKLLVFKAEELRDQFLENFRDLIETAKPLL